MPLTGELARIDDELRRAYDGDCWHGPPLRVVLKGVTPETAAAKHPQLAHSIWALVNHLSVWVEVVALRLAEGSHNHRPVNDLKSLVIVSAFVCLFSLTASWRRLANLTTFRGARLVRRLRSAERRNQKEAARQRRRGAAVFSPGLAGNGFGLGAGIESAALFGVALAGFAAVEDVSMRSALLAGLPSSSGGSSCGGGGGCGGGGCGGGGCGG